MIFTKEYIDLKWKGYKISIPFYANSGATNSITKELNNQGAKVIIIKTLQFTSTAAAGTPIQFNINGNILALTLIWQASNDALQAPLPLYYVLEGSQFTITSTDPLTRFVVSYQYYQIPKQRIPQSKL